MFLVCTHGLRSTCCARFGGPLAQALAARHPGQVWESTHVGGHRFAANLVILPHGLYYGPVGLEAAAAAISAYQRGTVTPGRYRGRAGQPKPIQETEHELLRADRALAVAPGVARWRGGLGWRAGAAGWRTPLAPGLGTALARRAGVLADAAGLGSRT